MSGGVPLGGPVWLFAQFLILGTVLLSAFVFADSLRPARREKVRGHLGEPLWLYTAITGTFLALLIVVQVIPGLQRASAVVSLATPFAIVLGVVYLLRVVFPKAGVPVDSEHVADDPGDSGE